MQVETRATPYQPDTQAELPFAIVDGERLEQGPADLHVPPHALKVFLRMFEGPLDLLLYLIRRQNIDVLNIPIAIIAKQYTHYIDLMEELQLDLAGEYLLMAALLAEIKSRLLLPQPQAKDDEEDPRAALVRRLQEYECYKEAADRLDGLPRCERDTFTVSVMVPAHVGQTQKSLPTIALQRLPEVFADMLQHLDMLLSHRITRASLSVRERMAGILARASSTRRTCFVDLLIAEEGPAGVIVTLLALLELAREQLLELTQQEGTQVIYLKSTA